MHLQVALAADGLSVQLPPALVAVATPRHPAAAAGTAAPAAAASGAPNNSSSNAGNAHAGVVWEEQVDDAVAAAGGMVTVVVVPADARWGLWQGGLHPTLHSTRPGATSQSHDIRCLSTLRSYPPLLTHPVRTICNATPGGRLPKLPHTSPSAQYP